MRRDLRFFVPIQEESENIIISPQKIGSTKPDGFDLYGAFLYHARWAEMSVSCLLFWKGGGGGYQNPALWKRVFLNCAFHRGRGLGWSR